MSLSERVTTTTIILTSHLYLASVQKGAVGYHVGYLEETNPEHVELFFKYLVVFSAWYYVTISISKVAICVMYRRLFPQRVVFIILCITVAILISTSIVSFTMDLAACRPFSANWAPPAVQADQCLNKEALFIWSTFPNIVTDVVMLVLPLPIIWKLHTTAQLKVALTATFMVGSMYVSLSSWCQLSVLISEKGLNCIHLAIRGVQQHQFIHRCHFQCRRTGLVDSGGARNLPTVSLCHHVSTAARKATYRSSEWLEVR